MYRYKARVIGAVGDDEIVAEIDLGFGVFVKQRFSLLGLRGKSIESVPGEDSLRSWIEKTLVGETFVLESHRRARAQFVAVLFSAAEPNCRHTWAESLNAGIASHLPPSPSAEEPA